MYIVPPNNAVLQSYRKLLFNKFLDFQSTVELLPMKTKLGIGWLRLEAEV